jgi:hypothetical protein
MPISSVRNRYSILQSVLAFLLTIAVPSATFATTPLETDNSPSATPQELSQADSYRRPQPRLFTVISPTPGDHLITAKVAVTLNITRQAYRRSLGVKINGKDISALFKPNGSCNNDSCTETAPLSLRAGLKPGKNRVAIRVDSRNPRHRPQLETLYFDWTPSSPNIGLDDSAIALSCARFYYRLYGRAIRQQSLVPGLLECPQRWNHQLSFPSALHGRLPNRHAQQANARTGQL